MFADYLYKVLYLQAGAMEAITRNPNSLKQLLGDLGPKLQQAAAVPSEYGVQLQADGTKTYPNKIQWREQSKTFQAAYQAFQMHPERYVHQTVLAGDLKEQIPIFPVGMLIADFSNISRLKRDQIKFGVDVRALVYMDGSAYTKTLVQISEKLKSGGVYISDSIRENFGKVYRLSEVRQAQHQAGPDCTFYIVTGPGVPGDDYNETAAIRSVIITKGEVPETVLRAHLTSPAYNIRALDDVVKDADYVRSLDQTGANYERFVGHLYLLGWR